MATLNLIGRTLQISHFMHNILLHTIWSRCLIPDCDADALLLLGLIVRVEFNL